MSESHSYDVFISYARADRAWAREWLLPRLHAVAISTHTEEQFAIGVAKLINRERAVDASRRTLIVLTPAWLADSLNDFEALLTQTNDPAGRQAKLLPLLLKPCQPPSRIAALEAADLTDPAEQEIQLSRVIAAIRGERELPTLGDQRLGALPLGTLPEHARLPPGSRLPYGRNQLFTGRAGDLQTLAAALKAGDTAAIGQIAAATGLGGIGKTQLAAEFAYRYGQFFAGGVFWLSFADAQAVPGEIAICGGPGHMALFRDDAGLTLEQQWRMVLSEWAKPLPRLLIFDNCEDEALLAHWRPANGGCRVLVTSRRPRWDDALGVQTLPLGVLPRDESVALLEKFIPQRSNVQTFERSNVRTLHAIAAELGDLPLALHLAGSYLKQNRHDVTPEEYLHELRSTKLLEHPSLQGQDLIYSATNHALHVGRTCALSYDQLDAQKPTDTLALALFARAAHFAPGEPIPRDLLKATVDESATKQAFGQALRRLVDLGLIEEEDDGALRLHRLLAAFARSLQEDDSAQAAVEQAMITTANRLNNAGIPAPLAAIQSHLRYATDNAIERDDTAAADLCNDMGYYLQIMIGDYIGAQPYYERSLAINEKVLGTEHPDTALGLNNLGALLWAQGNYAAARPYYERALATWEKVQGVEHHNTARGLDNLGLLLKSQGDYAGARTYYERALAIWEKTMGAEHPDTAISLNNLGQLLQRQGDYAGARLYHERAHNQRKDAGRRASFHGEEPT